MNNQTDNRKWLHCIETLQQQSQPVKIDRLLKQRMQAFAKTRALRSKQLVSLG